MEEVQFILEGYILKLAVSRDKALSYILQDALTCSLKSYLRKTSYGRYL